MTRRAVVRDALSAPPPGFIPRQRSMQPVRRLIQARAREMHRHGLADQRVAAGERDECFGQTVPASFERRGVVKC